MLLKLSYIALSVLMILVLLFIGFKAIEKSFPDRQKARKKKWILSLSLFGWHLYMWGMASTGFLLNYSFPPRFFLFLVLPTFLFTGIFLFKRRRDSWVQHIPQHWLVYYQSFRLLIESIFVLSVARGVLHYHVTIEGYNYDMVFAFSALVMGFLFHKKLISPKVVYFWNLIGLGVIASIIFLFLSTTYLPELYGSNNILLPGDFGSYPYVLVPGFLMPSAVFVHVLSLVQLSRSGALYKKAGSLKVKGV